MNKIEIKLLNHAKKFGYCKTYYNHEVSPNGNSWVGSNYVRAARRLVKSGLLIYISTRRYAIHHKAWECFHVAEQLYQITDEGKKFLIK